MCSEQAPKIVASKEVTEVLQPNQGLLKLTVSRTEALKCHNNTEHWYIVENNEVHNHWQRHNVDLPIHAEIVLLLSRS